MTTMNPSCDQVEAIDQLVRTIRRKVGQAKDRHQQKTKRLRRMRLGPAKAMPA